MDQESMRQGAYDVIKSENHQYEITNLIDAKDKVTTQADATTRTLNLIKRMINFALGLVSLIALIILIIAGVKMATAAGDDKQFGAGKAALTKVSRAIAGIALSWLIINGIFRLITVLTR